MGMKIYNHLRHYTQTTGNTKIPKPFVIASPDKSCLSMTSGVEKNRVDPSKTIDNFLDSSIMVLIGTFFIRRAYIR